MGPNEHRSAEGRVLFRAGEWFAELHYRFLDPDSASAPDLHTWRAGRFKRARNAMIALEDRVTELRRRFKEQVVFVRAADAESAPH
jgi:hypothetical protein